MMATIEGLRASTTVPERDEAPFFLARRKQLGDVADARTKAMDRIRAGWTDGDHATSDFINVLPALRLERLTDGLRATAPDLGDRTSRALVISSDLCERTVRRRMSDHGSVSPERDALRRASALFCTPLPPFRRIVRQTVVVTAQVPVARPIRKPAFPVAASGHLSLRVRWRPPSAWLSHLHQKDYRRFLTNPQHHAAGKPVTATHGIAL